MDGLQTSPSPQPRNYHLLCPEHQWGGPTECVQSKGNGPECALGYVYESEGRWICRLRENNILHLILSCEIFVALSAYDLKN